MPLELEKLRVLLAGILLGTLQVGIVATQSQQWLPPISYVCPMPQDAEVVEDKPGKCRKCGMPLAAVRLDSRWSCPLHSAVIKEQPGKCPIDKRELVQVTVSVSWTCPGRPDVREINPGTCADGKDRIPAYEQRAHGDHNPRHGGQFFMATDNWHHLEGTYPRTGIFRVFMYDDYTRPLAVKNVSGRAVTREEFDAASRTSKEIQAVELKPSRNGKWLEARVEKRSLPVQITAKIRLDPKGPEQRFDFAFPAYTKEPAGRTAPRAVTTITRPPTPPAPSTTSGAPPEALSAQAKASAPGAAASGSALDSPAGVLPDTPAELLSFLSTRSQHMKTLLDEGALTQVWVSAFESKDAALALETRAVDLPEVQRAAVSLAVRRLVLAAWRIDRYGDLGNKARLMDAYHVFAAAVADLNAAYVSPR